MKALIFKEWRKHLKWVPLPGLVILLVFSIEHPVEPMLGEMDAYYYCLTAVVFAAALGFLQIVFDAHGDKRSLLLHRPLSPSRIFLAKSVAGVSLYLLALGIPFACLERWYATPGNMPAPFHWRTGLPWLADILSGLVYYFAGMLTAQREARVYGSRGLATAAAFFCSYLVWALPEFWQALVAIGIIGSFVGVAAWGSFCTGGAYRTLPRFGKAALAMTMLLGLLILSMMGKQMIGEWLDPGMHYQVDVDHEGRVSFSADKDGIGEIARTDLNGQATDLKGKRFWYANATLLEWPTQWGYRHNGRFYVQCRNSSTPGNEKWYFDHAHGRLLGFDAYHHQLLGSFGPYGFKPAGEKPGERFQGELRYVANKSQYMTSDFLIFPGGVYGVDFGGRSIRMFFTPAEGETVITARRWFDERDNRTLVVVSTDRSFHVITEKGSPVVSMPRAFGPGKHGPIFVGRFENPERYFIWYQLRYWLREPEEYRTEPSYLLEYDGAGRELARRAVPPFPYPAASYAEALFGLVTPMTEAATLVGASQYVRSAERSKGSIHKPSLLSYFESFQYYIPGTSTLATTISPSAQPPSGLIPSYIALILLSAAASALGCFLLARRYAFSLARRIGWALCGFFFGWVGFVLMLVLQEWPTRVVCPLCRRLRVVTRDTCEHCGALHAAPVVDGTEIFEAAAAAPIVALTTM
jgi:hypothetical protein